eukprot:301671-Amphidinium_carterae.2
MWLAAAVLLSAFTLCPSGTGSCLNQEAGGSMCSTQSSDSAARFLKACRPNGPSNRSLSTSPAGHSSRRCNWVPLAPQMQQLSSSASPLSRSFFMFQLAPAQALTMMLHSNGERCAAKS